MSLMMQVLVIRRCLGRAGQSGEHVEAFGIGRPKVFHVDADILVVLGVDCAHVPAFASGQPEGVEKQAIDSGALLNRVQ